MNKHTQTTHHELMRSALLHLQSGRYRDAVDARIHHYRSPWFSTLPAQADGQRLGPWPRAHPSSSLVQRRADRPGAAAAHPVGGISAPGWNPGHIPLGRGLEICGSPVCRGRMPVRMSAVAGGLEVGADVGDSTAIIRDCWFFVVEGALKGSLCPGTLILGRPD